MGQALVIYLDRFSGNEPVTGAKIEVTAQGSTVVAEPRADGTFALQAPWLAQPGTVDMVFAVTAGDTNDLLVGSLEIPSFKAPVSADAPDALSAS